MPVSKIRTKIRQEFERHRYVNKLPIVDMLLTQCQMEFQVSHNTLSYALAMIFPQLSLNLLGNPQLLEADFPCHEVLSGRREPDRKITRKFHAKLPRGLLTSHITS